MTLLVKSLCAVLCLAQLAFGELPPPCHSEIYCHGPLLHTVQMHKIFEDSKTFVDMKMKQDANTTMQKFMEFMESHQDHPEKEDVVKFVNETFDPAGSEFEDWVPSDWKDSPAFLDGIKDVDYRRFASHLNDIWKALGRKMKDDVETNEHLYSIVWVPNPVIVPGGRFREFYYWDSYWIVQGLLLSEMHDTVKGMLSNFAYIIDEFGHIPNGGRVYYMQRSQPPLYIPMVKLYVDSTKDLDFVRDHIGTFEKEFDFWMNNHSREIEHKGKKYTLLAYGDYSTGPRPESYSEDVESGKNFKGEDEKEEFYSELKAAAESGWDFSSRWFIVNGTNKGNLTNIKTRSMIPVDLNALFYWNAVILADWHDQLGNEVKSKHYRDIASEWLSSVEAVLWHEDVGSWLDYDSINNIRRDYFFPSNLAPLFAGCYDKATADHKVRLLMKYFVNVEASTYPGGIPTSRDHTGEQWDYPNAWPPLQHMIIVGLADTGVESAERLAYELADKWVRSNYVAYNETEDMFEKYDATKLGGHGGGGEYEVQLGFGWSNGVVMDLLHRYGEELFFSQPEPNVHQPYIGNANYKNSASNMGWLMTAFMALIIAVIASYLGISIYRRRSEGQTDIGSRPSRAKYTELRSIPKHARSSR